MTTINDALDRKYEQSPQMDYLWRVELPSLAPSTTAQSLGTSSQRGLQAGIDSSVLETVNNTFSSVDGNMMVLNHRVYAIDTPYRAYDTDKATKGNHFWHYATHRDVAPLSITMDEFEDGKTLECLSGWMNLIENNDGTYNPPAAYKRDIRFIRLSNTKLDLHVTDYKGCFVNEIQSTSNNYDNNDILQYVATVQCGDVKHTFLSGASVKSRVQAAETDVLLQEWQAHSFNFGSFDLAKQSAILDRVSGLLF